MRSPTDVLTAHYDLPGATVTALPRGHTNTSFAVDARGRRLVLRVGWPGKALEAVRAEESLLDALRPDVRFPRMVSTRAGARCATVDGRFVHLFDALPGAHLTAPPTVPQARAALATLAALHAAMAPLPVASDDPLASLRARGARVFDGDRSHWPAEVVASLPRVRRRIDAVLTAATTQLAGRRPQWLHGDYHLGNLLFAGDVVTGVVDFDDCGVGAPAIDLAVALYGLARDATHEPTLRFDPELWCAGAAAYGPTSPWCAPAPLAEELFCAHQTLLHLEAARRGLWALTPGIGFYPCFNALCDG